MMGRAGAAAVGAAMMAIAHPAAAIEDKVYSPDVDYGVLEFEARGHRTVDSRGDRDNEQEHRYELGYGVTDWWQTVLVAHPVKEPEGDLRYGFTAWENIFRLTDPGKYWADVGLYFEYSKSHLAREPDEFEMKVLIEKDVEPFVVTTNLIFNREIGDNSGKGVGFEYAFRINYPWKKELQFAIEAFGEPGRLTGFDPTDQQQHILGPVLLGEFNLGSVPGKLGWQAGYLFGLTGGSPQGTVKWMLEYEVPF